jgi:putative aminopeptidase FrvX
MSTATLIITKAEITTEGILIREMKVVDGVSGEEIKIAKLTQELCDYLKNIEIDPMGYFTVKAMKQKNTAFRKLVTDFNLGTKERFF